MAQALTTFDLQPRLTELFQKNPIKTSTPFGEKFHRQPLIFGTRAIQYLE